MKTHQSIADTPVDERPRERLLERGPHHLRDAELLAILVGSGTRGVSAVELAAKILKQQGGVASLATASADELCTIHGVGPALAGRLVAARELFQRAETRSTAMGAAAPMTHKR